MMNYKQKAIELFISIHAPARGATIHGHRHFGRVFDFNPRTRKGCDAQSVYQHAPFPRISIHAPARGATARPQRMLRERPDFNPRTRKGCDSDSMEILAKLLGISIHAPARGATRIRVGGLKMPV